MHQKMKFLVITAIFAAGIGVSSMLYNSLKTDYELPKQPQVNQENTQNTADRKKTAAPDFTVFDADGNAVKLTDFKGKSIVLNFWASWCPPCRAEMPEFDRISQSLGNEVVFLMVNMTDGARETKEKAQSYVKKEGFTFPIYFDSKQSAASAYGVSALPTTHFIAKDGSVVKSIRGSIDAATLSSGVALIR